MSRSDYQVVCGPYGLVVSVVTAPTSFLASLLLVILKVIHYKFTSKKFCENKIWPIPNVKEYQGVKEFHMLARIGSL